MTVKLKAESSGKLDMPLVPTQVLASNEDD